MHDYASSRSFNQENGYITATENQSGSKSQSEKQAELNTDERVTKIDTEIESRKTITESEIEQSLVKDSPPDGEINSLKVENKKSVKERVDNRKF